MHNSEHQVVDHINVTLSVSVDPYLDQTAERQAELVRRIRQIVADQFFHGEGTVNVTGWEPVLREGEN